MDTAHSGLYWEPRDGKFKENRKKFQINLELGVIFKTFFAKLRKATVKLRCVRLTFGMEQLGSFGMDFVEK